MFPEIIGKLSGRRETVRSALVDTVADKNLAAQEGSGREHDGLRGIISVRSCFNTADLAVFNDQISDFSLLHVQIRLLLFFISV